MSHTSWLRQAESDLEAARTLSDANYHSQAIWLAGQAVEKAHKAIIVALGLQYQEKHFKQLGHATGEISRLLPAALQAPLDPEIAVLVVSLEQRAVASRYPAPEQTVGRRVADLVAPAESLKDSQQDVASAAKLLDWCRDRIVRAQSAVQAMRPPVCPPSPHPTGGAGRG